jgi:hypothetical protein
MELTETTRKLGKSIVVKVMKQMELTEIIRMLGMFNKAKGDGVH